MGMRPTRGPTFTYTCSNMHIQKTINYWKSTRSVKLATVRASVGVSLLISCPQVLVYLRVCKQVIIVAQLHQTMGLVLSVIIWISLCIPRATHSGIHMITRGTNPIV